MHADASHACLWPASLLIFLLHGCKHEHEQHLAQSLDMLASVLLCCVAAGAGSPGAHAVGATGTVTLDARFDCGYFVTVHIRHQQFNGMLYYPPTQRTEVSFPYNWELLLCSQQILSSSSICILQ